MNLTELVRGGKKVVFLSPHFDDVALSCGGAAALLPAGSALCVTVFSDGPAPDAELTAVAIEFVRSWGLGDDVGAANAARLLEEQRAMEILGLELRLLGHRDAIYRGSRYQRGVVGQTHPEEKELHLRLATELEGLLTRESRTSGDTVLVAPLGVGSHIDHRLVHLAARELASKGWSVLYYEDYPYADPARRARPAPLDPVSSRLAVLGFGAEGARRAECVFEIVDATLDVRVAAVEAYASQTKSLFAERGVRADLTAYTAWVAKQGTPALPSEARSAERYWRLAAT